MVVPRALRIPLCVVALLGIVLLALHIAHGELGFGGHALDTLVEDWVYDGVIVGGGISCLLRGALVRRERAAWLMLGIGLITDAVGEVYYSLAFGDASTPPIPSLADLFYLLYYPLTYVGLVLLVRERVHKIRPSSWLDGGIAAATAAAVVAAVAFEPILRGANHGDVAAIATNFAYPVGDVLLIAMVVGVLALSGWRPGRAWWLIGISLGLTAFADTGYLYASAQNTYQAGKVLDSLWIASSLVMGVAAWQRVPSRPRVKFEGRRLLVVPCFFGLVALAVLVYGGLHHVAAVGLACAALALLLVIVHGAWMFSENARLLASSRREAITDALTGIGNRRKLNEALDRALEAGPGSPAGVLVMFDLDGFKLYNDNFGHMAGDTLLSHFGSQFAAAVRTDGEAYRLGGDEFCALLYCAPKAIEERVAACAAALVARGEGFVVTASYGQVSIPVEADTPSRALRIADDRMYAHKGGRRSSSREQTHDVLLGLLQERQPELHDHLRAVGRLAVTVGRRLGMDIEQLDELRRAAELHDIGKAAIPEGILGKPGPLENQEMAFMRRHTLIGERILTAAPALAPVAGLVRASHERWDGEGYPDRTAGRAIPLGARVVSVCDAFDAMTSDRPYAAARPVPEALAELRRSSGTQFDPDVVEAFVAAWGERAGLGESQPAGVGAG